MSTIYISKKTPITFPLVFISFLASVTLFLFEGMDAGMLFFVGYLVIATITSAFKDTKYSSRRALG